MVLPEVLPDVFLSVEFRAVGWDRQQRDVGWHDKSAPLLMPTGAVDEEHGVGGLIHVTSDVFKVQVHGWDIRVGEHERDTRIASWPDGAEDVGTVVPLIARHTRA